MSFMKFFYTEIFHIYSILIDAYKDVYPLIILASYKVCLCYIVFKSLHEVITSDTTVYVAYCHYTYTHDGCAVKYIMSN